MIPFVHHKKKGEQQPSVGKTGRDVVQDAVVNKSTAFTAAERDFHHVRGLIPHCVEDLAKQARREIRILRLLSTPIEKNMYLMALLRRNETLFYKLLVDNVAEIMPLVYTPVVGEACTRYSELYSGTAGLYISLDDLGHVEQVMRNWGERRVRAIVVTDGERILGLGDLGANGMGIPVGKLQLYVACGGIHPLETLPVTLDVGTNNEKLREDEFYIGMKKPRERGLKYEALVAEFVHAVGKLYGHDCLIQWEDFGNTTAFEILEKYRNVQLSFNDDIQGTASVTLAGIISSLRLTSKAGGPKALKDHTFVFYGAGEAGVGIADLIADTIARESHVSLEVARSKIWLVDSTGLVCKQRTDKMAHHKHAYQHHTPAHVAADLGFNAKGAQDLGDIGNLKKIVASLGATALIGVSAQPQVFTKEVCEQMCKNTPRPLIFALSNPTHKAECTAEQAIHWTNGKCIFASGSPFADVTAPDGSIVKIGQANNAYIVPGVALGCIAVKVKSIPNELMEVAARSLALQASEDDLASGNLFPPLSNIRNVSAVIAKDVAMRSYELGLAQLIKPVGDLLEYIKSQMYDPKY